ncbi:hypothetical protein NMY22_g2789 [Coprinellus aureogranulatus]|nr:hypothetical protein NMY22_g2789 [Coprinellus aureogranulatus]
MATVAVLHAGDPMVPQLRLSNVLAVISFASALPSLGATSLFQTPFNACATLEFNRSVLRPCPPSPEEQVLIQKDYPGHVGGTPNPRLTPPSQRARSLAVRWAMGTGAAIIISSIGTFLFAKDGGPWLGGWVCAAWVEVVSGILQGAVLWFTVKRCRMREGRCDMEGPSSGIPHS